MIEVSWILMVWVLIFAGGAFSIYLIQRQCHKLAKDLQAELDFIRQTQKRDEMIDRVCVLWGERLNRLNKSAKKEMEK